MASWDRQARDREGALQETVSTLAIQTSTMVGHLTTFAAAVAGLAALLAMALIVDPVTTVVVILCGACLFALLRPIGAATRRRSHSFVGLNSSFTEQISQWTSLAMDLRVFGVDETEAEHLAAHTAKSSDALTRTYFASRFSWSSR
jgi:ABC-type multidrug transport system fused ATPase/permease subunit